MSTVCPRVSIQTDGFVPMDAVKTSGFRRGVAPYGVDDSTRFRSWSIVVISLDFDYLPRHGKLIGFQR